MPEISEISEVSNRILVVFERGSGKIVSTGTEILDPLPEIYDSVEVSDYPKKDEIWDNENLKFKKADIVLTPRDLLILKASNTWSLADIAEALKMLIKI